LLQTDRSFTDNDTRRIPTIDSRRLYRTIKLGKTLDAHTKDDITEFAFDLEIPDKFEYDADIKYLCYKGNILVGMMVYNIVLMNSEPTPLCVHIIGEKAFRKTRAAFEFMLDTFRDLKKDYKVLCTHIPNDRKYIINPMIKFGFNEYAQDDYGKYYYIELERII
jgi:hypothetical protein